jgi:hypothetical protein
MVVRDFNGLGVYVTDIVAVPGNVLAQQSQSIKLTGLEELKAGDVVWFARNTVPCATFGRQHQIVPPNAASIDTSSTYKLTSAALTSTEVEVEVNFSAEAAGADPFRLCIFNEHVGALDYSGVEVTVLDGAFRIYPQAVSKKVQQRVTFEYTEGANLLRTDLVKFTHKDEPCDWFCSSTKCTDAVHVPAPDDLAFVDFSQVEQSRVWYRMCVFPSYNAPQGATDYSMLGVYVTELFVNPNSFLAQDDQTVTLEQASIFEDGDSVWFKRLDMDCGVGGSAGGGSVDSTEEMHFDYSLEMDFSQATPSTVAWRLCVRSSEGDVLDLSGIQTKVHIIDVVITEFAVSPTNEQFTTMDFQFSLQEKELMWFQRDVEGNSDPTCLPAAPSAPSAFHSSSTQVECTDNGSQTFQCQPQFDFTGADASLQLPYKLCIQGLDSSVRQYSSIFLRINDLLIAPGSVSSGSVNPISRSSIRFLTPNYEYMSGVRLQSTAVNARALLAVNARSLLTPLVPPTPSGTRGLAIHNDDIVWFSHGEGTCTSPNRVNTEKRSITSRTTNDEYDRHRDYAYLLEAVTVDFTEVDASTTFWTLCVQLHDDDDITMDFDNVGVYVTDITLAYDPVSRSNNQNLQISYTNSLALGDRVWFKPDDTACGATPPITSGQEFTNSVEVIESGQAYPFDLHDARAGKSFWRMCVQSTRNNADVLDYGGVGFRLGGLGEVGFKYDFRPRSMNYYTRVHESSNLEFSEPVSDWFSDTAILNLDFRRRGSWDGVDGVDSFDQIAAPVLFTEEAEAHREGFQMCVTISETQELICEPADKPEFYTRFHMVDVLLGSRPSAQTPPDTYYVSKASAFQGQDDMTPLTISTRRLGENEQASTGASSDAASLQVGDKVWFASYESSPLCERDLEGNDASQNKTNFQTLREDESFDVDWSSNDPNLFMRKGWSLNFDFSKATAETYRLCVETNAGVIKDYDSVQVRVIDFVITPPTLRSNSRQPIRLEVPDSDDLIFNDGNSAYLEEASQPCSTSPLDIYAPSMVFWKNGLEIDTSDLLLTGKYRLCVIIPGDGPVVRDLQGMWVHVVDMAISPRSVHKMNYQEITIDTSSLSLYAADEISFVDADYSCRVSDPALRSSSRTVGYGLSIGPLSWLFDFSGVEVSDFKRPFRLCVDRLGVTYDFAGGADVLRSQSRVQSTDASVIAGTGKDGYLGGDFHSVFISPVQSQAETLVFPVRDQPVSGVNESSIGGETKSYFVRVDKSCYPDVDANGEVTYYSRRHRTQVGHKDSQGNYIYDFSMMFPTREAENVFRLCVEDTDANSEIIWVDLDAVTVDYNIAVDVKSVPANQGQLIGLSGKQAETLPFFLGDEHATMKWVLSSHSCEFASTENVESGNGQQVDQKSGAFSSEINEDSSQKNSKFTFDFDGMWTGEARLCVYCQNCGSSISLEPLGHRRRLASDYRELDFAHIRIQIERAVAIAGDPHVLDGNGAWFDFYGETGVYNMLSTANMEVNARFGLAVGESNLIWHSTSMKPGTVIEEVGIQLKESGVEVRLSVLVGGVVSVRDPMGATRFLTGADTEKLDLGDVVLSWAPVHEQTLLPWGSHERSHKLTVKSPTDTLNLFLAESQGYSFIDVELQVVPNSSMKGILGDALLFPSESHAVVAKGAEKDSYSISPRSQFLPAAQSN